MSSSGSSLRIYLAKQCKGITHQIFDRGRPEVRAGAPTTVGLGAGAAIGLCRDAADPEKRRFADKRNCKKLPDFDSSGIKNGNARIHQRDLDGRRAFDPPGAVMYTFLSQQVRQNRVPKNTPMFFFRQRKLKPFFIGRDSHAPAGAAVGHGSLR